MSGKTWILYEINNPVPIKCEREDYKKCPEHGNLSLVQDYDGFAGIAEDEWKDEEYFEDNPGDNIVSPLEYDKWGKALNPEKKKKPLDARVRVHDFVARGGHLESNGYTEYAIDSKVYNQAKQNVEGRKMSPGAKVALARMATIGGLVGGIAGIAAAFTPIGLVGLLAAPLLIPAGYVLAKKPQVMGDRYGMPYFQEKEYLKEYMRLKGMTDMSQLTVSDKDDKDGDIHISDITVKGTPYYQQF